MLSKLEAGQERRDLRPMDAAAVLKELCESFQPLAAERGLFLQIEGPPSLTVQGDVVNIQRIAQNLILNALKYTHRGGVRVVWQALETDGLQRWMFTIEDTGPGFQNGGAAPLADAIAESTAEAEAVDGTMREVNEPTTPPMSAPAGRSPVSPGAGRVVQTPGEGIGLAIVKRLCELLDATVELESEFGRGSIFRVVLPRYYDGDCPRNPEAHSLAAPSANFSCEKHNSRSLSESRRSGATTGADAPPADD